MNSASSPIQAAVMAYFQITREALCGRMRHQRLIGARHVAFYLEVEIAGRPFADIGRLYDRDHSSVVVAYHHMIERVAAKDDRYVGSVDAITAMVTDDAKRKALVARRAEDLQCPTCGAPVIKELQRQIALLNERVSALGGINGHSS